MNKEQTIHQVEEQFNSDQESLRTCYNPLTTSNLNQVRIEADALTRDKNDLLNYFVDQSQTNHVARIAFFGCGAVLAGAIILNRDYFFHTGSLHMVLGTGLSIVSTGSLFMGLYTTGVKNLADQNVCNLRNDDDLETQKLKVLDIKNRYFG